MPCLIGSYQSVIKLNRLKKVPEITEIAGTFLYELNRKRMTFNFIRFLAGFEYKGLKEKPQALKQITVLPQILDH